MVLMCTRGGQFRNCLFQVPSLHPHALGYVVKQDAFFQHEAAERANVGAHKTARFPVIAG
jgi:hypothetical protein